MKDKPSKSFFKNPSVKLFLPVILIIVIGFGVIGVLNVTDNRIAAAKAETEGTDTNERTADDIKVEAGYWVSDSYYADIIVLIGFLTEDEASVITGFQEIKASVPDDPDYRIDVIKAEAHPIYGARTSSIEYDITLGLDTDFHYPPSHRLDSETVHLELGDLGSDDNVMFEGSWDFDLQVAGAENTEIYDTDIELEDMGYSVRRIAISGISVCVELEGGQEDAELPETSVITQLVKMDPEIPVSIVYRSSSDVSGSTDITIGRCEHYIMPVDMVSVRFSQTYDDPSQPGGKGVRYAEVSLEDIRNSAASGNP